MKVRERAFAYVWAKFGNIRGKVFLSKVKSGKRADS